MTDKLEAASLRREPFEDWPAGLLRPDTTYLEAKVEDVYADEMPYFDTGRLMAAYGNGVSILPSAYFGIRDKGHRKDVPSSLYVATTRTSQMLLEHTPRMGGEGSPQVQVECFPGLSEDICFGYSEIFHDELWRNLARPALTSIGANGIGIRGVTDHATRETVAEDRLQLLQATDDGRKRLIIGTSMGTVNATDIVNRDLDTGRPSLDLQGMVFLSPAIVDPSRSGHIMMRQFPLQLGVDVFNKIRRTPLLSRPVVLGNLAMWANLMRAELPSLNHQRKELMRGTPREDVERMVNFGHRILVIAGKNDAVAELNMWEELRAEYPDKLHLVVMPGHGHELAFTPDKAARQVAEEIENSRIVSEAA